MAIYAVKKGFNPGLYKTWAECKAQVSGYPNAKFKKFQDNETLAIAMFMEDDSYIETIPTNEEYPHEATNPSVFVAYTDGSYNPATKECGAGVVLFHNEKKEELFRPECNTEATSMRNVAGEILAATMAIEFALKNQATKLIIRHDYIGISEWANGNWKTNNIFTRAYKEVVADARQSLTIEFEHVNAHTGVRYNEEADNLAKRAVRLL